MVIRINAAERLANIDASCTASKLEASPSQGAAVKALKHLGFYPRKIEKDGQSIQVLTQNDPGEIFLILNRDSLQTLKAMFARDENLQLSFYTTGAVKMGVSVVSTSTD